MKRLFPITRAIGRVVHRGESSIRPVGWGRHGSAPRPNLSLIAGLAVPLLLWSASVGLGQTVDTTLWCTNGPVRSIVSAGSTIYIGGDFTYVGSPYTGIGVARNGIAAFDAATGALTSWDPNATGSTAFSHDTYGQGVTSLAVSGGTVYAAGYFTGIGGQPRSRIAALDATTGAATEWDPGPCCGDAFTHTDPYVRSLAVSGGTVYAAGYFSSIGGQPRNGFAALDATTGAATAWNPGGGVNVRDVVVSGGTVYVGGGFISIGGQPRNWVAALDPTTGAAAAWDPNANGGEPNYYRRVEALAISEGKVYAGGNFSNIGGQPRNDIAALDAASGAATAWNPNPSGGTNYTNVIDLVANEGTVYACGNFTSIGGQARNQVAALDPATGAAFAWDPNPNGFVYALAVNGDKVYVGGNFTSIGGHPQSNIAAISAPGLPVSVSHRETPPQSDLTHLSPNPTSGGTQVQYGVARQGRVRLEVLDVSGRVEETLADRIHTPGRYVVNWDGAGHRGRLSPGLHFVRLVAPDRVKVRKLAIIQ